MKVNVNVALDDTQRRKVRGALGMKGKASRAEVRVWVNGLMQKSLDAQPEPKVRKRLEMDTTESDTVSGGIMPDGTAPCTRCGKFLSDHGGARKHCPLSKTVKPGSTYKGA